MPRKTYKPRQSVSTPKFLMSSGNSATRYIIVAILLLAALRLAYGLFAPRESALPEAWHHGAVADFHVLLVTLDTTRADRIGCYGHKNARTPVLDSLAAGGVRFADAVSSVPLTLPSHSSMFTGLAPPKHGVRNNGEFRLPPTVTTLAEVLKEHGYDTAAFVSAFVLDARFGLDQGFDHYDAATAQTHPGQLGQLSERSAEAVTDSALTWLRGRDSDERPFFMWVHYFDPHLPYNAPATYKAASPHDPYDAEIAYMDAQIGRLFDGVRATGAWDKTLIIVAGDHGESLGEHGESDHSLLVYGSTQRVPLLLASPGLSTEPHVVDGVVVGVIDVFPTVLDLLGIERSEPCDGVSLVEAAQNTDRVIYMETMAPFLENGWSPLYALRRHRDKFILAPQREYYDLRSDPHESRNLYTDQSPQTQAALAQLEGAMEGLLQESQPLLEVASARDTLDDETRARLASLGYVTGMVAESNVDTLDPKYLIRTWEEARKAKTLTESGDLDQAMAKAKLGLAISPRDRKCLEQIGIIYAKKNQPVAAEDAFRRAIDIRPSANLYVALAQVLVAQDKLDQAWRVLDRAEILEPANGGIYITRGDILCMQGDIQSCRHAFQKARKVDPYRFSDLAAARLRQFQQAYGDSG